MSIRLAIEERRECDFLSFETLGSESDRFSDSVTVKAGTSNATLLGLEVPSVSVEARRAGPCGSDVDDSVPDVVLAALSSECFGKWPLSVVSGTGSLFLRKSTNERSDEDLGSARREGVFETGRYGVLCEALD